MAPIGQYVKAFSAVRKAINPKELGYFCDGAITFANKGAAQKFAKNWALKGIHCKSPHENLAVLKNNKVLYFGKGEEFGFVIKQEIMNELRKMKKLTLVHGHPNTVGKKASPLSIIDFDLFNREQCFSKMIAYDNCGKSSLFHKTNKFKLLDEEQFAVFGDKLRNHIFRNASQDIKTAVHNLDGRTGVMVQTMFNTKNPELQQKIYNYFVQKQVPKGVQLFDEATHTEGGIKKLHEFWQKVCPKLGIDYKTNFGYLT